MEKENSLQNLSDQKTPKKNSFLFDGEKLLDKINILTRKSETNCSNKLPTIKDFVVIKPISRGAFGKVFLGYKNTDPNKLFALKVMRKSEMIYKNMVSQVITERNALALSRSPFCVNLFYSLQSTSYVYLVMEYMVGGDLKSLLAMYGFFDESAARFYVAEVALALQYLHEHGIVHRDIKPDNMLLSETGHVKLTDFGLSKIELRRDLEISDLINCSPNLFTCRTPGQLLSLTSHLSFGSDKKIICDVTTSKFNKAMNNPNIIPESSDSEADTSCNDNDRIDASKISGVSPFLSAEEINVSVTQTALDTDSSSSYHTCSSGESSQGETHKTTCKTETSNNNNTEATTNNECGSCVCNGEGSTLLTKGTKLKLNSDSFDFSMRLRTSKGQEDSGVSSRRTDCSNSHTQSEMSSLGKVENICHQDDSSSSDYSSRSYDGNENQSPLGRSFKRPEHLRSIKRKINLVIRSDISSPYDIEVSSNSTGLTQEIDILDIGSSTPKKRKTPVRGVLKVRNLSDDEMPTVIDNVANVLFSTPVSSQKLRRECGKLGKLKSTRFNLPLSLDNQKKENLCADKSAVQYMKIVEDLAMSPINLGNSEPRTPITVNTPFRTPKSVRRGVRISEERILGTPDYLAPELLLMKGHGAAVDWWALGVCLYEFMTGIPPFNDETPQKVFDNILHKNIEWPQDNEALSTDAVEAVELLLTMDPAKRPAAKEVKKIKFFSSIDWTNMEKESPPFVPRPENPTDTGYFDARNNMQHLKLSNFVLED